MALFRNFYRCAVCGHEWTDEWSAMRDDDCPHCDARHMSPYKSDDADENSSKPHRDTEARP
jgi:DNA-directed RNA polymerase subunit RPC12/RpoP